MALSVSFVGAPDGDDGPFQLATANGWKEFAAWAEQHADCPALQALVRDGTCNSRELAEELERVDEPISSNVSDTLDGLVQLLGDGDPAERVLVEG